MSGRLGQGEDLIKMLFLDLYTLPNSTTLDQITIDTITQVPAFTPAFLVFVFGVVLLGGIIRQKAKTGISDVPLWATIASLSTFMMALIMSVTSGFLSLSWLVLITVITIFSGVWLFLDRRQSEI